MPPTSTSLSIFANRRPLHRTTRVNTRSVDHNCNKTPHAHAAAASRAKREGDGDCMAVADGAPCRRPAVKPWHVFVQRRGSSRSGSKWGPFSASRRSHLVPIRRDFSSCPERAGCERSDSRWFRSAGRTRYLCSFALWEAAKALVKRSASRLSAAKTSRGPQVRTRRAEMGPLLAPGDPRPRTANRLGRPAGARTNGSRGLAPYP
jgi:hypothetical protein